MYLKTETLSIDLQHVTTYKGHEGEPLYQFDVIVNGKLTCEYQDGDWGGPCLITPVKGAESEFDALNTLASSMADMPLFKGHPETIPVDLDLLLGDVLLNRYVLVKTLKAQRKCAYYVMPDGEPEVYDELSFTRAATLAEKKRYLTQHHPDALTPYDDPVAFLDVVMPIAYKPDTPAAESVDSPVTVTPESKANYEIRKRVFDSEPAGRADTAVNALHMLALILTDCEPEDYRMMWVTLYGKIIRARAFVEVCALAAVAIECNPMDPDALQHAMPLHEALALFETINTYAVVTEFELKHLMKTPQFVDMVVSEIYPIIRES